MNKKTRQNVYFCSELTDNSKLNPIKDEKNKKKKEGRINANPNLDNLRIMSKLTNLKSQFTTPNNEGKVCERDTNY